MDLAAKLRAGRRLRVVGFDDAPFDRDAPVGTEVLVSGVVCAGVRFEGMVATRIEKDGWDATERLIESLAESKFLPQLHAVLIDGVAFGGFNVVDLPTVAESLAIPVIAVTRREPDFDAIREALQNLDEPQRRLAVIARAGRMFSADQCWFQVAGTTPEVATKLLAVSTDRGHIPEAIRMAHLIGSAVITGESGSRA